MLRRRRCIRSVFPKSTCSADSAGWCWLFRRAERSANGHDRQCPEARRSKHRNRSAANTANRANHYARPAQPPRNRRSARNPRYETASDLWPEIDDDLDVAFAVLERLVPALEWDSTRNQPSKPTLVRAHERGRRRLVVPPIGLDRPEDDVVVEHHGAVEAADIDVEHLSRLGDTG